ncbi:hypothetical protein EI534_03520 [Pseudomonas frederiksbergensis]|nr:hypothetical protein [Pseudomonas frederiksbergensis]
MPDDYAGDPNPDKKMFSSRPYATPHTSEFEVELAYKLADCTMVLSGFDFMINGQPGTNDKEYGMSSVELEVESFLKKDEQPAVRLDEQVLSVRCHWKGPGSSSTSRHTLECFGLDANGQELKGPRLGMLKIRQLQGLTLRLKVSVADTAQKP